MIQRCIHIRKVKTQKIIFYIYISERNDALLYPYFFNGYIYFIGNYLCTMCAMLLADAQVGTLVVFLLVLLLVYGIGHSSYVFFCSRVGHRSYEEQLLQGRRHRPYEQQVKRRAAVVLDSSCKGRRQMARVHSLLYTRKLFRNY
jgi:hypothetical protein